MRIKCRFYSHLLSYNKTLPLRVKWQGLILFLLLCYSFRNLFFIFIFFYIFFFSLSWQPIVCLSFYLLSVLLFWGAHGSCLFPRATRPPSIPPITSFSIFHIHFSKYLVKTASSPAEILRVSGRSLVFCSRWTNIFIVN